MPINLLTITSLILVVSTLTVITIVLKYGTIANRVHTAWLSMNICVLAWAAGATILSIKTLESGIALQISKITFAFVTLIALSFLFFIYTLIKKPNLIICIFLYTTGLFSIVKILDSELIVKNLVVSYNFLQIHPPGPYYIAWFSFWLITILLGHSYVINYYLNKEEKEQKKEMQLLISSLLIGGICGTINFFYYKNFWFYPAANFGITFYCFIFTYAVLKHQIMGLEIVFRKGLLYSTLITIFTCIYLSIIFLSEWLFRGILGYKSIFLSLLSAVILALLFNPIKNKIQYLIDKMFLGKAPQEIAAENEALKQEIERSERLKAASTLALGLAHEVKNPLTVIKIFTEFLQEKKNDEKFFDKFSKIIPQEVERINTIVHKLLDFSKPSPPVFKQTDICRPIKEIVELMSNDFLKRKINIFEQYEDLVANIDTIQIKQVLFNILLNAMEAMPRGGNIRITTRKNENNQIEICVADEGIGIVKEDLKNIFNPFFSKKDNGTGLGLAICHQIIKQHGGTIEAESEINRGATFRIKLPLDFPSKAEKP